MEANGNNLNTRLVIKIGLMHEIFVLQKAWLKSFVLLFLLFCQ